MGDPVRVYDLDRYGVVADLDDVHRPTSALERAENAVPNHEHSGGIRKRPGLVEGNDDPAIDVIIGGVGVPLVNRSTGGVRFVYLGRAPL